MYYTVSFIVTPFSCITDDFLLVAGPLLPLIPFSIGYREDSS